MARIHLARVYLKAGLFDEAEATARAAEASVAALPGEYRRYSAYLQGLLRTSRRLREFVESSDHLEMGKFKIEFEMLNLKLPIE